MITRFEMEYTPNLDRDVGLAQELNVFSGEAWVGRKAESEIFSSGYRHRENAPAPEETLAVAIVRQAAEDWMQAACRLRLNSQDREAQAQRRETEAFFRSQWFHTLMDLEGEELLTRMRRLYGRKEKRPDTLALERRLALLRRDAKQRGRKGLSKARRTRENGGKAMVG